MKKSLHITFLLIAFLLYKQQSFAQVVKSIGGTNAEYGQSITYDANGFIYIIGNFRGKADFNPGTATYYLQSSCPCDESEPLKPDVFFAKYSKTGALVWANKIGGSGYDYGKDIAVDASGNVYVTGSFESTANFGAAANSYNLTSNGNADIFLAKYNSSGQLIWAHNFGGVVLDEGTSLSVTPAGEINLTGYFNGAVDFDASSASVILDAGSSSDPFFARYDTNGNLVWAKDITGTGETYAQNMYVDNAGSIYITGNFFGTSDFNVGTNVFNLTSAGAKDAFYAKYTSKGDFVWATSVGNSGDQTGQAIIADKTGNVYATGYFIGTVDFNPGSGVFNLTSSAGFFNAYLLKLDVNGNFLWANNIGGNQDDIGFSLALDAQQNIYNTGYFNNTASFSSNKTLTSSGSTDIYVAIYKPNGSLITAVKEGGATDDWASDIAIDKNSNVYLTGYYTTSANFTLGNNTITLTSAGNADVYFAKAPGLVTNTAVSNNVSTNQTKNNSVQLYQNIPNPFINNTSIGYYLPKATTVHLSISDISGKQIMVIADGLQSAGKHTVQINSKALNNGVYNYRLQTDNVFISRKLIAYK